VGGIHSQGFVEVLAASQSNQNKNRFQGTADAVRQYMWLFDEAVRDGVEDFLILSGKKQAEWHRQMAQNGTE
jgi:glucose-1-phosphate adenylyltransferase